MVWRGRFVQEALAEPSVRLLGNLNCIIQTLFFTRAQVSDSEDVPNRQTWQEILCPRSNHLAQAPVIVAGTKPKFSRKQLLCLPSAP